MPSPITPRPGSPEEPRAASARAEAGPAPDERRRSRDRRDPERAHLYVGVERRKGPRRNTDLPTPLWQRPLGVILAAGLGVAAALLIGGVEPERHQLRQAFTEAATAEQSRASAMLAEIQAMRDQAEALTPAEVALDERAAERWIPRVASIERAREDPATPTVVRSELDATIDALIRAGVLSASDATAPARTLERPRER